MSLLRKIQDFVRIFMKLYLKLNSECEEISFTTVTFRNCVKIFKAAITSLNLQLQTAKRNKQMRCNTRYELASDKF